MRFLKVFRQKSALSQKKLAEALGVDENTVWRWENERATPSVDIFQRISEVLGCSERELLNGPQGKQLTITIDLEGVNEMTNEAITAEGVFFGYRAADDAYVIRGAIPAEGKSEEEIINSTLAEIAKQLRTAFAGRKSYKE